MSRSVLYLIPDLFGPPGGIARHSRLVCRALLEARIKIKIISLADQGDAPLPAWATGPLVSYRACQGSKWTFVQAALVAALSRRPAIILLEHPNFSVLGWFLARLVSTHWMSFIHGTDVWTPLKPLRRRALQRADRILSVSRFTADQAIRTNGLSPDRIRILHNCLDPHFEIPIPLESAASQLSMLTVARMSLAEQLKGHDYVIRAMPALLTQFPKLIYHVVGDGDGRPALEALAVLQGVSNAVKFHGIVSEEVLHRYYAEASLFIMPSRSEGFGLVFLEAMAHGTPIIGGNVDATSEVIVDGETGYVVDPTSIEAIVEAASRLLADENLRHHMGRAAWRRAQEFRFAIFGEKLVRTLRELVPTLC